LAQQATATRRKGIHIVTDAEMLEAAAEGYRQATKEYNLLTQHGYRIVRGCGCTWIVTHGIAAWGGFTNWDDALDFAVDTACEAKPVVVH
jgi:hypothetical protein